MAHANDMGAGDYHCPRLYCLRCMGGADRPSKSFQNVAPQSYWCMGGYRKRHSRGSGISPFAHGRTDDAGAGVGVQIAVSALAFGAAHAAWVGLSGEWKTAFYTVISTVALGALLAWLYILADRSTIPAIAAHIIINLGMEPWLMLGVVSNWKSLERARLRKSRRRIATLYLVYPR